jgi:hypothetical protein
MAMLASCSQDIVVPQPDIMAEGPVVECIIEADSHHLVRYSRVVPISEPFNLPSQAHVTLEISGAKSKLARNISPGNFMIDDFFVKARDSFHFQLFSPDDTVKISDVMPSNIVLTKTDTLTQAIAGIGLTQVFSIQFRDSAIDENYYRLSAARQTKKYVLGSSGQKLDSAIEWQTMKIDGNETPFVRNNFNNYTEQEILFSDEIFNGVLSTFRFHNLLPFQNTTSEKTMSVLVTLENISFATYQYYNSRAEHLWSQKSITQLPGPVQTNIPKGYGVLGASTSVKWLIVYPD